jgi:hypothetical protein
MEKGKERQSKEGKKQIHPREIDQQGRQEAKLPS